MPDANELEKYYKTLTDQELLTMKWEGGFTAEAERVLGEELARRNVASVDLKLGVADDDLTFDEFAAWIREYVHVPSRKTILPETRFERDLGLTGDDGTDLLKATEKRFKVTLGNEKTGLREVFNLGPNEYLFNSEGSGPSPGEIVGWFSGKRTIVREFTVGELFQAVKRIMTQE